MRRDSPWNPSLRFPARKDKCANPGSDGKQADGARDEHALLSFGGDVNGIRIDDLLSHAVHDSRRSEQNQSQQDQQAADDSQPQGFCPSHVRMVADVKVSERLASVRS